MRFTDPFGRQAKDENCDTACQIKEQYERDFGKESELAQRAQHVAEGASKTADIIEAGAEMAIPLPAAKLGGLGKLGKFLKRLIKPASKAKLHVGQKITKQMGKRGWSQESINEAIQSGTKIKAVNRATDNPATRFVHPETGQSVVVDNVTGEVIHIGGPGFRYGPHSGDLP